MLGVPHECSYLPDREAQMAYVASDVFMTSELYALLLNQGFRRSGEVFYRPHCSACTACMPIRIPVADFEPNRSQTRIEKANADLAVIERSDDYCEEHYELYIRYLNSRHQDGMMAQSTPLDFQQFLMGGSVDCRFVEFRDRGRLVAVAVVDQLHDGLSAVYTFFDPLEEKRGLGANAIIWQVRQARQRKLNWLYLGFWIAECRKMSYKNLYRPMELRLNDSWVRVRKGESIPK